MKSINHKKIIFKHWFLIKTVIISLQTNISAFQYQTSTHFKSIGQPTLFLPIQKPFLRKSIYPQESNRLVRKKVGIQMNMNVEFKKIDPISSSSSDIVQTSLIGPFSVSVERHDDFQLNHDEHLFETWKLHPIPTSFDDTTNSKQYKYGVGALAIKALQDTQILTNHDSSIKDNVLFQMDCQIKRLEDSNEIISIHIQQNDNKKVMEKTTMNYEPFIEVTSKLMIQRAMMEQYQKYWESLQSSTEKKSKQIRFEVHFGTTSLHHTMMIEHSMLSDSQIQNIQEKLCMKLFDIEDENNSIELVDMVDSNKNRIAILPRSIVHTCNILHRGIGMIVCQNAHIHPSIEKKNDNVNTITTTHNQPMVYVHRRTDTKRIFPSLYDMFIGGVSLSGEESIITAAREVAEELGLTQALKVIENNNYELDSNDSILRGPLFDCTICTAYNRCIVTMFTYRVDEQKETFKWQEEEVAWGDYVPYDVVKQAGHLSIERLKEKDTWPGIYTDNEIKWNPLDYEGNDWKTWDFVPDGLLVWEAWNIWWDQQIK